MGQRCARPWILSQQQKKRKKKEREEKEKDRSSTKWKGGGRVILAEHVAQTQQTK